MIDRSVTTHLVHMRCPLETVRQAKEPSLPDGYSFALYCPGMGADWSDICFDAGLFDSLADAMSLFNRDFLPHMGDLMERMWFVLDPNDRPVATTSAWYTEKSGERMGMIHWVAARPEVQGKGLGRAVVEKAFFEFNRLEPGRRACLDTGTPNWHAICLYHTLGFRAEVNPEQPDELRLAAEELRGRMSMDHLALLGGALTDFIP